MRLAKAIPHILDHQPFTKNIEKYFPKHLTSLAQNATFALQLRETHRLTLLQEAASYAPRHAGYIIDAARQFRTARTAMCAQASGSTARNKPPHREHKNIST